MNKFYWLLVIFVLGGFLLFPEASWGWILLLLGVGIFIGGAKAAQESPLLSLGGLSGLALGLFVIIWGVIALGDEDALSRIFDALPWWAFIGVGPVLGIIVVLLRGRRGR